MHKSDFRQKTWRFDVYAGHFKLKNRIVPVAQQFINSSDDNNRSSTVLAFNIQSIDIPMDCTA